MRNNGKILGERNSYSKTDPDATFMRMKEDHMLNGQLKPGYNVQIGTENGFVLGYDIFPNPTDTKTLKPHLENMKQRFGMMPQRVIADAGYGSNDNLAYLEELNIEALVKYNTFHKEATRAWKKNPFRTENWPYDPEHDRYTCPEGRNLEFVKLSHNRTEAGYQQTLKIYSCVSCADCPKKRIAQTQKGNDRFNAMKSCSACGNRLGNC